MLEFIPASGIFHTAEKCRTKKQRLSPGAVHICISDILPVAGEKMSRRNFLQRREFFPAERFDIGAPSAKAASSGQIHRTGGSPSSRIRRRVRSVLGSATGTAESSAFVYGCLGKAYSSRAGTTSTASSGEITCAVTPGRSSSSLRLRTQKLQDMLQTGHTGRWILPLFLAAPKHGCWAKTCSLVAIVSLYCIHLECIKKQINRVFSNQSRLYHPALSPSNLFYNYIFP